jgi:transposase
LSQAQRQQLEQLLRQGPEKWGYEPPLRTCPRVAHLIGQEWGVRYQEGHVWRILIGLGWRPQRPVGVRESVIARERNEEQILRWKKEGVARPGCGTVHHTNVHAC